LDFRASSLAITVDRNDNFLFQAPAHARTTCWPIHCMCIYLDSIWLGLCYMDRACIRWLLSSVVSVLVFAARCYIHTHSLCRNVVSVRLSVTFVDSWSNRIFKIFSSSGSHIIRVFPYQTAQRGVECRWGRQNSRFSTSIWLHRVRMPGVINTVPPYHLLLFVCVS